MALIQKKEQVQTVAKEKVATYEQEGNFYQVSIKKIESFIKEIKTQIEQEDDIKRLLLIPKKLKNQEFSIGVTGVMNAGKSTMLNALLGESVLGTSVVPETANLTLLKYSDTKKANVNFWTKDEWQKIEQSADEIQSLEAFVKETKELFGDEFNAYITNKGYSQEVDTKNLAHFTSAEHSNKKCNLVKSVELFSDLKFLKDGVVIVDTPGLDDPVIQREEITKGYLSKCDLMLHLMNVNQSATQKDVEFICDTLLYQNVSRLLIIITRIDTVSKDELKEVIGYTKKSIKEQLISINKESSFNSIIDKLNFIPIAAKIALDIKTQKVKKIDGYTLVSSGILEVEEYLSEVLFGKQSEKAKILITSAAKELISLIGQNKKLLLDELHFLDKDNTNIEDDIVQYETQIQNNINLSKKFDVTIQNEKEDLKEYFITLKNLAQSRILQLQSIIKRRVIDDVSYEKRRNKQRPQAKRIEYFIDTGIKDGFIELLREYRYGFEKKMSEIFERIKREFSQLEVEKNMQMEAKEFFQIYFNDTNLSASNKPVIFEVNNLIDSYWKKDIDVLDSKLESVFEKCFREITTSFLQKSIQINENLYVSFEELIKSASQNVKNSLKEQQQLLEVTKERMSDSSFDIEKRVQEIKAKIDSLDKIEESISSLRRECE